MGLLALFLVPLLSSCAQLQVAADKSIDGAVAYCKTNTDTGRKLLREGLTPSAVAKDVAIGLRCPGDTKMHVTGDPKEGIATD